MASGTPVPLAILQALQAELAAISSGSGDDTTVAYTGIGDEAFTNAPKPAAFLRPGYTSYGTGGSDTPTDALSADFQVIVDVVVDTVTTPEVAVLKFERDVVQAVLDFADTHPGGALDIKPVSSDPWIVAVQTHSLHGSTLTFTARYRASRSDLNLAV